MSHTRVKTTYSVMGSWGDTETRELYCHHYHSSDCTVFYDANGEVTAMNFEECDSGNNLWDAMNRLWSPYKGEWDRSELKDNVEYYIYGPWENKQEDNGK